MNRSRRSFRQLAGRRAFTLFEIVGVVAIMAVLSAISLPFLGKAGSEGRFNQALINLSGALEKAQSFALANNTYAVVAVTEPDASGEITVAIFGSRDGAPGVADLSKSGEAYPISEQSADGSLVLLESLASLNGVKLADSPPATNALKLSPASAWSRGGASFTYSGRTFTRALQFTPGGEARVSSLLPDAVQIVLVPVKGGAIEDAPRASAIQVSGLTGVVRVLRPGDAGTL